MKCHHCGGELPPGAKFCRFCGAEQDVVAQEDAGPTCQVCGSPLLDQAKFCNECGAEVPETSVGTEEVVAEAPVIAEPLRVDAPVQQPVSAPPQDAKTPPPSRMIAIVMALGVAIAGVAGYVAWDKHQAEARERERVAAEQAALQQAAAEKAEREKNMPGLDLLSSVMTLMPGEKETYTAPDPLAVKKAFKPCKLQPQEGDLAGKCELRIGAEYLVEENVDENRFVEIKTSGTRTMVFSLSLSAGFPNHIHHAFDAQKDWNIETVDCPIDTYGEITHSLIYVAHPPGKRKFAFETSSSSGSGGEWGTLTMHLQALDEGRQPCDLVMHPGE